MLSSRVTPHLAVPLPHHCPVTGLPVVSHSSWTYTSPGGGYRLRVSFIGDRIVWLQPQGYVFLRHAQKGMALVEDVLFTMEPEKSAFIAIDDFSAVAGATLDARRFIIRTLRRQQRLKAYIVYNPTTIFRLRFELSRRLGLFHFDVRVAADYAEAVAIAHARLRQMVPSADAQETTSESPPYDADSAAAVHRSGEAAPLARYAAELLAYVGNINLETYGLASTFREIPRNHPFRSVFDALSLLRDDMQAILQRHRKARANLELRQKELVEKQEMLSETHTTLSILLAAREKERQRLAVGIKDRFYDLLAPLMDELDRTSPSPRQRVLMRLLRDVTVQIGTRPPYDPHRLQTAFTARENLLAFLISAGLKPREIADLLQLSRRTIENHCQRMRGKAGLKGRRPTLQDWLTRPETTGRAPAGRTP
jgi:DNA-binding CsgD family transcriptional regulator